MPRAILFISVLGALLGCVPKSAPATTPTGNAQATETSRVTTMPPYRDSVCRGYAIPDGLLPARCTAGGPYPGMIQGTTLGPASDLTHAVESCLSEPDCTGISADWYIDADFTAVRSEGPFTPSDDAYGCTFLIACSAY